MDTSTPRMLFVYVLKCKKDKYYIGRTTSIARRLFEHWDGEGSQWTRLYPPISVERIIETHSTYEEGNYVKEYMHLYGIDNVRGGAYVTETLTNTQIALLTKEIREAKNLCMTCGSSKHFCSACPNKNKRQSSPKPVRQSSPKPVPSTTSTIVPSQKRVGNMHRSPTPTKMAGHKWTTSEETLLLKEYESGLDIETLAIYHERTQNAIRMKLISLGYDDI